MSLNTGFVFFWGGRFIFRIFYIWGHVSTQEDILPIFPNLFFSSPDCTGLFGSMLNGKWRWMPHLVLCLRGMVFHLCQWVWCPLWASDLHQVRAWIVREGIFHLLRGLGNACLLFYSGGILLSRYEFHLVMVRYHLFRCCRPGLVRYRLLPM